MYLFGEKTSHPLNRSTLVASIYVPQGAGLMLQNCHLVVDKNILEGAKLHGWTIAMSSTWGCP